MSRLRALVLILTAAVIAVPRAQSQSSAAMLPGSPGPMAGTCGVPAGQAPAGGERGQQPVFPEGKYPVQLPAASLLGARNDGPNPFQAGRDWGQLPPGRMWGST